MSRTIFETPDIDMGQDSLGESEPETAQAENPATEQAEGSGRKSPPSYVKLQEAALECSTEDGEYGISREPGVGHVITYTTPDGSMYRAVRGLTRHGVLDFLKGVRWSQTRPRV